MDGARQVLSILMIILLYIIQPHQFWFNIIRSKLLQAGKRQGKYYTIYIYKYV